MKLNLSAAPRTGGAAFDRLKRNIYNFALLLIAVCAVSAVLMLATAKHTEENDGIEPKYSTSGDYAMNLQHYATFDHSDTHIGVYFDWRESSVVFSESSAPLRIKANVKPVNIDGITLEMFTSNPDIATVDKRGRITVKNSGTVEIYALAMYGDVKKTARATLNVIQPVTGIFMPVTTTTLYLGSTGQLLTANVFPENCSNKNVIWESKDESIAVVDANGHVRPAGPGMTEVTATTRDGGFTGKCYVSVVNYAVTPDKVTIQNDYKDDAYLKVGESFNIVASVMPSNAKDKTLSWVSANPEVASVSQKGKVKALAEGETYVTVSASNGKQDTLKLTVQANDDETDAFDLEQPDDGQTNYITAYAPGSYGYGYPVYASNVPVTNGTVTYMTYDTSLPWMVRLQMGLNPPPKKNGGSAYASESEVAEYMNPESYCTGAYKYQFLDLSHPNGISEESLNAFLSDKGVMRGHAADFISAAHDFNVSEIYLVAHACLETGNGTSTLARGVEVNGTVVYNMFGIGAYDNSAVYSGSQKAYKEGWTSVSAAIRGGAQWISTFYVNSSDGRQNTLYKMLWNPDNPGQHQYATDIQWATSQAYNIEKLFSSFPEAVKTYEVPVYSGMSAPVLDAD